MTVKVNGVTPEINQDTVIDLSGFDIRRIEASIVSKQYGSPIHMLEVRLRPAHDATRGPGSGLDSDADISVRYLVPPGADKRWIRQELIKLLTHELDEWLRIDGEQIVDPHPEAPRWIPYEDR